MLRVKTVGTRSNRDGIGAKVTVKTSTGTRLFAMVKTGSSYLSQSELPLTFGLGKPEEGKTVSLTIVWPSGQKDFSCRMSSPTSSLRCKRERASSPPGRLFLRRLLYPCSLTREASAVLSRSFVTNEVIPDRSGASC